MSYVGTPHTFTVGEVVTAATMNAIRDFANGVTSTFDLTWTPVLSGSTTAPTLGTGSSVLGEYTLDGLHGRCKGHFAITAGTSGTTVGSGAYLVNLPVSLTTNQVVIGDGYFFDASTQTTYDLTLRLISASQARFYFTGNSSGSLGAGSATIPGTLGVNDQIRGRFDAMAA